jgi:ABC-type nitrate/sulfonate/bicarbonate transport system permease component
VTQSVAARGRTGTSPVLLGAVGLLAFVGLFEILPRTGVLPEAYFPPASTIARTLGTLVTESTFWVSLGETVQTWVLGLAIAVGGGIVLGMLIGSLPVLRAATASTIEFLRPIPSVALIPLVIVLVGTDMTSTLILVVYASFWQMLIQVLYGVADVDPVARETALSYRLGVWARMRYLVFPTALPYALTGVRLAASVALILAVTGELVIGSPGLGHDIENANSSNAIPRVYALIVVTGLIGVSANLVARTVERYALVWHPSVRADVPL